MGRQEERSTNAEEEEGEEGKRNNKSKERGRACVTNICCRSKGWRYMLRTWSAILAVRCRMMHK